MLRTIPDSTTAIAPGPTSSRWIAPMSLYDRRRSVGAKFLAEMPATIVAIPPPSHRVKPRTCTSSQNPRIEGPCDLLTVHHFRNRLPAGVSRFEFMPMLDPVFPGLPAPEDISPLELAVEIDQSLIEPLEHAADLRELGEIAIDLARHVADAAAQLHLLRRLAPFRLRLRDEELVLGHEIAPLGMEGQDVGHDPLDKGEGSIGFGEGEVLAGHDNNIRGKATTRRIDAQR